MNSVEIKTPNAMHDADGDFVSFVSNRDDAGKYICSTSNDNQQISKEFYLHIVGKILFCKMNYFY